jgi:hypothetical protein
LEILPLSAILLKNYVSSFRCRTVMRGTPSQTDSARRVSALRPYSQARATICNAQVELRLQDQRKRRLRPLKALLIVKSSSGIFGGHQLQVSGVLRSNF